MHLQDGKVAAPIHFNFNLHVSLLSLSMKAKFTIHLLNNAGAS